MQIKKIYRVNCLHDVWTDDKSRLKISNPNINVNWDGELASDDDSDAVLDSKRRSILSPTDPIHLTDSEVSSTFQLVKPMVESVFGANLTSDPIIQVVPSKDYPSKVHQLLEFIYGGVANVSFFERYLRSRPMANFPSHNLILIPSSFTATRDDDSCFATGANGRALRSLPWERSHFEAALSASLSIHLLRQSRGELNDGFARYLSNTGMTSEPSILFLQEAIALRISEELTRKKISWTIHVVQDKMDYIASSSHGAEFYLAVEALSAAYTLHKTGMTDGLCLCGDVENEIDISFREEHHQHSRKLSTFNGNITGQN